MMSQLHTIRYVAMRTGLSQHAIRAWEKRYNALSPSRTVTNRRLYTEEDLEKLLLLRQAVEIGHTISQIAMRSVSELRELVEAGNVKGRIGATADRDREETVSPAAVLVECL